MWESDSSFQNKKGKIKQIPKTFSSKTDMLIDFFPFKNAQRLFLHSCSLMTCFSHHTENIMAVYMKLFLFCTRDNFSHLTANEAPTQVQCWRLEITQGMETSWRRGGGRLLTCFPSSNPRIVKLTRLVKTRLLDNIVPFY